VVPNEPKPTRTGRFGAARFRSPGNGRLRQRNLRRMNSVHVD